MMMDNENKSGLLGGFTSRHSGLTPGMLNVDIGALQSHAAPEFIVNEDIKRGKLENSFSAIGTSLALGGLAGGSYGLYEGMRNTANSGLALGLRRTQILNHILKSGGSGMNSLGAIAFMYSSLYCLMSLHTEDHEDVKNCASGALTGLLYKSSAGLKKGALGGAFGLGLAALWTLGIRRNEAVQNYV